VVPRSGMDGEGRTFRVNSDSVALEIAKALSAVKLVYMTTSDGLSVDGAIARQVSVGELAEALQRGAVPPEQLSKARHAVAACQAGVQRVHVINRPRRPTAAGPRSSRTRASARSSTPTNTSRSAAARRGDVRAIEQTASVLGG